MVYLINEGWIIMTTRKGYCPIHKEIVKATTNSCCSSLFCTKCKGLTKLTRKPKEE